MTFAIQVLGQSETIWIEPNKGQWNQEVNHRIQIPKGFMYVNSHGFVYSLSNYYDLVGHNHADEDHGHSHEHNRSKEKYVQHVISADFVGSSFDDFSEYEQSSFYINYFKGKNPENWANKLRYSQRVIYHSIYENVDLELYGLNNSLKYNLLLQPNCDIENIKINYSGQSKLFLRDKVLHIETEFGTIKELKPIAYYADTKEMIPVEFILKKKTVQFKFPQGFDSNREVVLDPEIVFSTFTGAVSDNWGNTATPGPNGEAYAGGIVFGANYPITAGVFQSNFYGGQNNSDIPGNDIVISKFSPNGSQLLYSTFLGGSKNEIPHSMIYANDRLYVYGTTGSPDFPVTSGSFQSYLDQSNFTSSIDPSNIAFDYSDIFITAISEDGSNILASTYYGGDGFDGINNAGGLLMNYGDQFKGEINVTNSGEVVVVSNTQSTNLITTNALSQNISGANDGFVVMLNTDLSQVQFASYIGGSSQETAFGVDFDSQDNIYIVGGTSSSDFLAPHSGSFINNYEGDRDGYILKINGSTYQLESVRFIATDEYDNAFFVRLDPDDFVYTYGQSLGDIPLLNVGYADTNSTQFIQKYSNDLSNLEFSTVFGTGRIDSIDIAPTAFKVSDCYEILVAGYGGAQNRMPGGLGPDVSTTFGLNITPDAFFNVTTGNDFYVAHFEENMGSLKYATYMGSGSLDTSGLPLTDSLGNQFTISQYTRNHVDGGTSRFDNYGEIYHAVCATCKYPTSGGFVNPNNGFTITPNAYSPTAPSNNCNMALFKFRLLDVNASLFIPPGFLCANEAIVFENNSTNGSWFEWDFGDGNTSSAFSPTHTYTLPGDYTVTLTVFDTSTNCLIIDTFSMDLEVFGLEGQVSIPQDTLCPGESLQIPAYNGNIYSWSPPNLFDDPTSNNPIATADSTAEITVIITGHCRVDTIQFRLNVYETNYTISDDTMICQGEQIQLLANGGANYYWNPSSGLNDPFIPNPIASPNQTTTYIVETTTAGGCTNTDTVEIEVIPLPPSDILPSSTTVCIGSSVDFNLDPNFNYTWGPDGYISTLIGPDVTISPVDDLNVFIEAYNVCGTTLDTMLVEVNEVEAEISNDTVICKGSSFAVSAAGGNFYSWSPPSFFDDPNIQNPTLEAPYATEVIVTVIDNNGCSDTASMNVDFYPTTFLNVSPDYYGLEGDTTEIWVSATNDGTLFWTPAEFIACTSCDTTLVYPPENMTYTANFIDIYGCRTWADVNIYFEPLLYIPNTFTPNADGMNDLFGAKGGNFKSFELLIFNRWGELIFEGNHIDDWWDASYKGQLVQDGVYVWKIRYEDLNGFKEELYGHVTVLR